MIRNTILVDSDLVYIRPSTRGCDDDLTEIGFEDMEPLDETSEAVGVPPYDALALFPSAEFDCVGVHPFGAIACTPAPAFPRGTVGDFDPDAIPTEEFARWDQNESGAVAM